MSYCIIDMDTTQQSFYLIMTIKYQILEIGALDNDTYNLQQGYYVSDSIFSYMQTRRLVEEMREAVKDPGSHQAAQTFMALIQLLRKSNRDTLEKQADRMLGSHDPTER